MHDDVRCIDRQTDKHTGVDTNKFSEILCLPLGKGTGLRYAGFYTSFYLLVYYWKFSIYRLTIVMN